jgi:hypothetical protein
MSDGGLMPESIAVGTVDVTVPAHPEALVFARLHVAALGRMLDLDVDEVADLRLAIEELALVELAQPRDHRGRLRITMSWADATIEATCELLSDDVPFSGDDWDQAYPRELSLQILGALVDEHGVEGEPGARRAWLRKKRSGA